MDEASHEISQVLAASHGFSHGVLMGEASHGFSWILAGSHGGSYGFSRGLIGA